MEILATLHILCLNLVPCKFEIQFNLTEWLSWNVCCHPAYNHFLSDSWWVFTKALFFLLSIYHVASVPLRLVVLTLGFSLTPSIWLLLGRFLWMVFRPGFACFCCFAWWTSSTFDYGHCVRNTNVYLTEGRSARDIPKQLPAKKISDSWFDP